jgi:predicted nucleic acid-binding protein
VSGFVVVDASLAFKWLVSEENSDKARAISRSWANEGIQAAAPYLMQVEVANVLHRWVVRGELSVEDTIRLLEYLLASGIELRDEPDLHARALQLASQLRQGAIYDAHYLALADILGCEFWTADERFYRAAALVSQSVRWIGEFPAP